MGPNTVMMELIKIAIVFFIVLALTYKKISLWISLLVSTFLLGFLFHLPFKTILWDLLLSATDRKTLLLIGALVAILFFSNLLKGSGKMDQILEGFRHVFKDVRVVIAVLPAMIGLMPLLGGALVSAPMVVEGSNELKLSPGRRTFINYWFRHLWEYILPTYPALIIAATLVGIPVTQMGWINLPLSLIAIVSGILVGFWGVSKSMRIENPAITASGWRLFKNLLPLLFALGLVVGFNIELVYAFGLTIFGMIIFYRIHWPVIFREFKESLTMELLLTVVIVMGFKTVLESTQAIHKVLNILLSSGIPIYLIAILIPLLIGLMTGLTTATIGISFPILIPLFQNDPNFLNYMMLTFASGITGHLLSPFHLCLVLTNEYFGADLKKVYRFMWMPAASILLVGFLKAVLLKTS